MRRITELARFGVVGATAFTLDTGGANLMWALLGDGGHLTGKAFSATVAVAFSYFANRHWTFRDRARSGAVREGSLFLLFNAVAVLFSLLCLGFTVYVLDLHSLVAKNVAANVVGVALGTAFRYWTYTRWVFPPHTAAAGATAVIDERKGNPDAHSRHGGSRVHRLPVRTRGVGR